MTAGRSRRELDPETYAQVAAARMLAVELAPYLASGLYRLRLVAAPGLRTVAVDRWWRLYVDPDAFDSWSIADRGLAVLHEISHVLRDHPDRGAAIDADLELWNWAADAEINDDLDRFEPPVGRATPFDGVPETWVTPRRLRCPEGETAEYYYRRLLEDGRRPSGPPGGGPGPAEPATGGSEDEDATGDGTCGSGAGGERRPWELDAADPEDPGLDEATADLVRRQVAQDTLSHARSRGTVPAGFLRWAEAELEPAKVPWRKVLAGAVKRAIAHKAGQVDYSYRRPGRRRVPKVLTPSMRRPLPTIAVVVDTSASMSEEDVVAAISEVRGIIRQVGIRGHQLRLLSVDAEVQGVQPVFSIDALRIRGGGGTDMRVGIAAAERLSPSPDAVIVLTDGATPWPEAPGRSRLIVGIIGDGAWAETAVSGVPDWATSVLIPPGVGSAVQD